MEIANSSSEVARARAARRNFVIDRRFQLKYALGLFAGGFVLSLAYGSLMYRAHLAAGGREDSSLVLQMLILSAVLGTALGILGLFVSHKVAGPLFVIGHYLAILGKGRYPVLRPLRQHDELKGFFELFSYAVSVIEDRERREAEKLREVADKLASGDPAEAIQSLRLLAREKVERVEELVERPAGPIEASPRA